MNYLKSIATLVVLMFAVSTIAQNHPNAITDKWQQQLREQIHNDGLRTGKTNFFCNPETILLDTFNQATQSWDVINRLDYTYDSQGREIREDAYLDSAQTLPQGRNFWYYDTLSSNDELEIYQNYQTGAFVNSSARYLARDQNDSIVQLQNRSWNTGNNNWDIQFDRFYTNTYNSGGQMIQSVQVDSVPSSPYVIRRDYFYGNTRLDSVYRYVSDQGGPFELGNREIYERTVTATDEINSMTLQYLTGTQWKNVVRNTYSRSLVNDSSQYLIESGNGSTWEPANRYDYISNSNGLRTLTKYYEYPAGAEQLIYVDSSIVTYDAGGCFTMWVVHFTEYNPFRANTPGRIRFLNNTTVSAAPETTPTLDIFPNPVRDALHLRYNHTVQNGAASIRLFDLQGRTVHQETLRSGSSENTIDLQELPAGLYHLEFRQGEVRIVRKVMKQQ